MNSRPKCSISLLACRLYFVIGLLLSMLPGPARALTDYTWTGAASSAWGNSGNWSPAGVPSTTDDVARFTASHVRVCSLSTPESLASLVMEGGYTGTLALVANGSIVAADVSLTSGTLTSAPGKVVSTATLTVAGGSQSDLTANGTASILGGDIGLLRMAGTTSLSGETLAPKALTALTVSSGTCTMTNSFLAGILSVAEGATLELATPASLTAAAHSVEGTLKLGAGSALVFANGANLAAGTLDASQPGSAIVCNGEWKCTAAFLASSTPTNALTVVYSLASSTIDHGTNSADIVAVRNGPSLKSVWTSSNTVLQVSVLTSSTLEIAAGAVLSAGAIANAGTIVEVAPGHIHHAADGLEPVNESLLSIASIDAGESFRVLLRDGDEALNVATPDLAAGVRATNPRNGDFVELTAAETGGTTTLFATPAVPTESADAAVAGDAVLQVIAGDTLAITYTDSEDATDNLATASLAIAAPVSSADHWAAY